MWQKARIVQSVDHPEVVKRLVWAKPPITGICWNIQDKREIATFLRTNMIHEDTRISFSPECLELLPEFAEDVPLISWQNFLEGKE